MSEMEVTEGQLLSQDFGAGGPSVVAAPERTLDVVEMEIRVIEHQTGQAVLNGAIELGRRLEEAKAMVGHGGWGPWLKKMGRSQSNANDLMRVFREYGNSQQSLFGGESKSQTFGRLTYTKALRLLAIPDEDERERFAVENDVEHMSVRELKEALKARDEAEEKAVAAEDEARRLRQETERLRGELANQDRAYKTKLTAADVETTEAKRKAREAQEALDKQRDKAQRLQEALSEANSSAQATEEEHTRLLQELEELKNRPVDVAVEVDQTAVDKLTERVNKAQEEAEKAEEKRKAAEEALTAAHKELAELKAKGPEVRELTQEEKDALTAEAVERIKAENAERMQALEKQLSKADPDTTTLMVLFKGWQETYTKMWEILHRIEAADSDKAQRLRGGIRKALETALEQMT